VYAQNTVKNSSLESPTLAATLTGTILLQKSLFGGKKD
jgi:hypothetical protein